MNEKEHEAAYDKDHIHSEILDVAKDGRIACKKALELASALNVPPRVIGEALDELKIKIAACQLGCFK